MEESSTSASSSVSGSQTNNVLVSDDTSSTGSATADITLLGYRRYSELGRLSNKELLAKQRELNKILNGIKATLRYDLGRSKARLLEDLRWVLLESPDLFEVHHLERIIGFLHRDEDCRKELWNPIQQYLPVPLRKMGLENLLRNNYLGAHHLKSRMDRFVVDNQAAETNSIQEDDAESFDDERVHTACELPPQFSSALCFVLRE